MFKLTTKSIIKTQKIEGMLAIIIESSDLIKFKFKISLSLLYRGN